MLPKQYRLPGYLIPQALSRGRTIQSKLFALKILEASLIDSQLINLPLKNSYFTFVISSKLDKKATKRNKAKRRLKEAVRLLLPEIKPGFFGIFLAKKVILQADFKTISREVKKVFQNVKLLEKQQEC